MEAYGRIFGTERVFRIGGTYLSANPSQCAMSATQTAKNARAEAELLRSLTPADAVARIEQTRVAEAAREDVRRAEQGPASRSDYGCEHRHTHPQIGPSRGL